MNLKRGDLVVYQSTYQYGHIGTIVYTEPRADWAMGVVQRVRVKWWGRPGNPDLIPCHRLEVLK